MRNEGPRLELLTHRLSECPPEFLLTPRIGAAGQIDVTAIACDHFRQLGTQPPIQGALNSLLTITGPAGVNRLRLIAIAVWVLHDQLLVPAQTEPTDVWMLLSQGLDAMARVVKSETVVTDPDRREELIRLCLKHLGLRPAGETIEQATDRLTTLDSVERERIVSKTRQDDGRAEQVRNMMAQRAAEEAAAKTTRE